MHGWFCPIRLIYLIGPKSLYFEKTRIHTKGLQKRLAEWISDVLWRIVKFVIFHFRGSTLNCWQWIFSWIATISYIFSLDISRGSRLNFIYFITSVPYIGPRVFFLGSIWLLIKSGWAYWPERKNPLKFWKPVIYTQFRENIGQLYFLEKKLLKNEKCERNTFLQFFFPANH